MRPNLHRVLCRYRDYGHDLDNLDTLHEAGLGFTADFDKPGGFVGRDATLSQRGNPAGLPRRLLQVLLADGWVAESDVTWEIQQNKDENNNSANLQASIVGTKFTYDIVMPWYDHECVHEQLSNSIVNTHIIDFCTLRRR